MNPEEFELQPETIPEAKNFVDDTETVEPQLRPDNGAVFGALKNLVLAKGKRFDPSIIGSWAGELLVTHDEGEILEAIAKVDADTKINAFALQLSHVRAQLPKAKTGKKAAHWGFDGEWGGDWDGVTKARKLQAAGHMWVCFFSGNAQRVRDFLTMCRNSGLSQALLEGAREHRTRAGDLSEEVCAIAIKTGDFPAPKLPIRA